MPRHSPVPRPPHALQFRQQAQRPELRKHLLEQILRRASRLHRRRPHQTTRAAFRGTRRRAAPRALWRERACRGARGSDGADPEDVDSDGDGAGEGVGDGVVDGV